MTGTAEDRTPYIANGLMDGDHHVSVVPFVVKPSQFHRLRLRVTPDTHHQRVGHVAVEIQLRDLRGNLLDDMSFTPHVALWLGRELQRAAEQAHKLVDDAGAYLGGVVMVGSKCDCGADADTAIHSDLLGEFDICEPCGLREIERMRAARAADNTG